MGGGWGVGEETADLKRPLNRPSSSRHGLYRRRGRGVGVFFLGEVGDDCAAPAALLVSSVAADACSATALHHQHPGGGGGGVIRPRRAQFPVSAGTRGSPMMFML